MPSLENIQSPRALIIVALLLTACGGGGGGGSSSSNFTADKPITITEANAPAVVAEGTAASVDSGLSSALGTALKGDNDQQLSTGHIQKMSQTVTDLVDENVSQLFVASRSVSQSTTLDCENGGTITLTISGDVNENTGNGSFSGTISASNCSDEAGESVDGSFSISGNLVNSELDGAITAEFDNFSVQSSEGSGEIQGTMIITERETVDYEEITLDATDCAFTFSANGESLTIGEFTFVEKDYFSSYIAESLEYTANSSRLGGSFQFATIEDFITQSTDDYPSDGQALITGENNGKIRITPTGGEATSVVTIEVDADGDGTYESTRTDLTWADLEED